MPDRISPAALYLRVFLVALLVGPVLASWALGAELEGYRPLLLALLPGAALLWFLSNVRLPAWRPFQTAPFSYGQPIRGALKLLALLVLSEPSAIYSLTGTAVAAAHPESGNPILLDQERPSWVRLLAEGIILLALALIWSGLVAWVAAALPVLAFTGLMLAFVGSLTTLAALLQRFGWLAGSSPIQGRSNPVDLRVAPLIPSHGPNRFRAITMANGAILIRPDIVGAPYESYVIAHEEGHIHRKDHRMLLLEPGITLALFIGAGFAVATWGILGLWCLFPLYALRSFNLRFSYRSELAVDEWALEQLGREACLAALQSLALEDRDRPQPWPMQSRYAPTVAERIERLSKIPEV